LGIGIINKIAVQILTNMAITPVIQLSPRPYSILHYIVELSQVVKWKSTHPPTNKKPR